MSLRWRLGGPARVSLLTSGAQRLLPHVWGDRPTSPLWRLGARVSSLVSGGTSPRLLVRVWGPASPCLHLGPSIFSLVCGGGQGRGEAQGADVGLAWPSPVCSSAPERKPRPGKPRLSGWLAAGAPERLKAGFLPPHWVLTSYLLLHREQVKTGGVLTQVVSAAPVAPGVPHTFGVSLGDGVFKLHFSVEHKVGGFLLCQLASGWYFPPSGPGAGFITDGAVREAGGWGWGSACWRVPP